jgi:hypothetical protein
MICQAAAQSTAAKGRIAIMRFKVSQRIADPSAGLRFKVAGST